MPSTSASPSIVRSVRQRQFLNAWLLMRAELAPLLRAVRAIIDHDTGSVAARRAGK